MTKNKDAFWFKHDANARNDLKILRLRIQHGMEGYGIYFGLIEILRDQSDFKLSLEGITEIAYDLRCSEDTIKDIINGFDLFHVNEKYFWSTRLADSMDKYKVLCNKRIEAGRSGGLAKAKQTSSKGVANGKQVVSEEKRGEEKRGEESITDVSDETEDKATPIIWTEDQWQFKASHDLFRLMKANNNKHTEPDFQKWASTMDMIERINGHEQKAIKRVLFFSQHDDFWRQTCHSPTNLRKNFIKIQEKARGWTVNRETGDVYKTPPNEDIYGDHAQC